MQTTYSVPGISCSHCRWAIDRKVKDVTGVAHVDVDVAAKQVTVTGAFDDAVVREALTAEVVDLAVALGVGDAAATAYGCDLTKGYIDENASYYSS